VAGIARLQIRHQFPGTRVNVVKRRVRNGHVARLAAGTLAVQLGQNVGGAANAAVVLLHTTPELHTAVTG